MKKLFTFFALMVFSLNIHAAITIINYELKDSYGDGWNNASLTIVDATTGGEWAKLTISSGSESSGSVRVLAGHTYNIVWTKGNYDSECSFTLTDARGIVFLTHAQGTAISAGTLLEYRVPIKGDVNGDFDVNIADVMDVVSYVINGDTSTPVQPPTPATVEISYELYDSYGDGWNGAAIRIVDTDTWDEVAVLTIGDGDYSSGTVTLTAGHRYDFYWQAGGWDSECSFTIYDSAGEYLYSYYYQEPDEPIEEPMLAGVKKAKIPFKSPSARSRTPKTKDKSMLTMPGGTKTPLAKLYAAKKKSPAHFYDGSGKRYPKEPEIPVEVGLYDGEVFFSYTAPGDASSSTPAPSPTLLRDINGDKDVNISDVMQLVSMVIYGTPVPDIAVSKETIEVLVYSASRYNQIDITDGSGNYEVNSSDPDNLKVYVSGWSFTMNSNTLGTYVVTVRDKVSGKTKDIQVVVKEAESCCPDNNHPHMIDLGLPSGTKWACCNVDATSPETFGGYYAWGETAEKSNYSWATYTHCDGTEETCHDLGTSIIGTKYDVAHFKWGDNWYMPSYDQVYELFWNTESFKFTSMNGVRGLYFTGSNGNNIFLPCGGWKEGTEFLMSNDSWAGYGLFWLGTLPDDNVDRGNNLNICYNLSGSYAYGYFRGAECCLGYNVRPVSTEKVPLAISATSVSVENGGAATVEITSGSGSYEAASSASNVAEVSVSGATITIVGLSEGTSTLTLKDTATGTTLSIPITVTPNTSFKVEPDDVSFGVVQPGNTYTKELVVTNLEPSTLTLYVTPDAPFMNEGGEATQKYRIKTNGTKTIKIVFTPEEAGEYSGNISFKVGNSTIKVPVQATCVNSLDDQVVIERKYWVKYGGSYCYPNMTLTFDNNTTLTVGYYKTGYWDSSYTSFSGVHILSAANGDCGDANYRTKDWYIAPTLTEQWVREKLILSKDGHVKFYMNNEYMGEELFDKLNLGSVTNMSIVISPYGWWTGHEQYMDNFGIYTANETFFDDFNDGEIDLSFWQAPVNPSGVREEDGIIKMEQLQTDQDFCLRTKTLTLNFGTVQPSYLTCPDDHHPHMIDLGLPSGTKWACCNVDTDHPENQSPTNYGGYYAWGETETKDDYAYYTYYINLDRSIAGTEFDVAYVRWGYTWQMPSKEQIDELLDNCSSDWITLNGVSGRKFTAANGGSIFLPAADLRSYEEPPMVGNSGCYWSSTLDSDGDLYWLFFSSDRTVCGYVDGVPECGYSVRPVSTVSSAPHLQLSTTTLYDLPAFEAYEVEILSGSGSYTVESSDENIARGHIEDNIIYILADGWGEATITVTDTQTGETATIEVSFYAPAPPFSLSESELNMEVGQSEVVVCLDGSAGSVESSDEAVATASITDDGDVEIQAVGPGTATITVTDTQIGQTATVEVTVTGPYFYFSENNIVMEVGETVNVHYESNTDFGYSISDESVAVVDRSGGYFTITAVGPGSATIEVDYGYSGPTYHATLEVTVTAPSYLTCPDDHHPHMIDLGLPSGTKWACCNVGADKPEAYGGYYAWGETEEKDYYDDDNYEFFEGYEHWDSGEGREEDFPIYTDLGSNIAGTQHDVAHYEWGDSWVMPSWDQMKELSENCAYKWTTVNGVYGMKFTSNFNGCSIFMPAAGYRENVNLYGVGRNGIYWSSTQHSDDESYYANKHINGLLTPAAFGPMHARFMPAIPDVYYAYYLEFISGSLNDAICISGGRGDGRSVRPVALDSTIVPDVPLE